jgi:hypothetical protein
MAEAIRLERSIVRALQTSAANKWLTPTTLTSLANLVREVDSSAAPSSIAELTGALLYLAEQGLLSIRQRDHGKGPVLFDEKLASDEFYVNRFFGQGAFELKLKHKARRTESSASALADDKDGHKVPRTAIVLNVLIASPSDDAQPHPMGDSFVPGIR